MESGTEQNLWTINPPGSNPEYYVYQLAEKTNCTRDTDPEMVDCLRELNATEIRHNQKLECTVCPTLCWKLYNAVQPQSVKSPLSRLSYFHFAHFCHGLLGRMKR